MPKHLALVVAVLALGCNAASAVEACRVGHICYLRHDTTACRATPEVVRWTMEHSAGQHKRMADLDLSVFAAQGICHHLIRGDLVRPVAMDVLHVSFVQAGEPDAQLFTLDVDAFGN